MSANRVEVGNFASMKRAVIEIFSELGDRLAEIGSVAYRGVIEEAMECNSWFIAEEICRSAVNVSSTMLSRNALERWLFDYPSLPVRAPKNILIVMAGNIPLVGLHDLICVIASGHNALVKFSTKDKALMSHVVGELLLIEPSLSISEYSEIGAAPDAVIAMGGDKAVEMLRNRYAELPLLLRGNRSSLAVISGEETESQLNALAEDIFSYSALGCRNVSLIFIPTHYDMNRIAEVLRKHACRANTKYLNNYRQTKALLSMNDVSFIDCGFCVLCERLDFPLELSRINYTTYCSADEIADFISTRNDEIQCIVSGISFERSVGFGLAQKPTLSEYPDGHDTMEFLASI